MGLVNTGYWIPVPTGHLILEPLGRTKASSFGYYYLNCHYSTLLSYCVNCSGLVFQFYFTYFLNGNTNTHTYTQMHKWAETYSFETVTIYIPLMFVWELNKVDSNDKRNIYHTKWMLHKTRYMLWLYIIMWVTQAWKSIISLKNDNVSQYLYPFADLIFRNFI